MKNTITILLLSLLFSACQSDSIYSDEDLMGSWNAFIIETNGDIQEVNKGKVNFQFNEADYKYKGGIYEENGTWKIKGDLIETKVENQLKKQVRILKLQNDTLVLEMNDNGVPMGMSLVKE